MWTQYSLIVLAMTSFSFLGGLSFSKYVENENVLWLIAGFSLFSLSNLSYILLIDLSGLTRALVIASSANILLTAAIGHYYLSDQIGFKEAFSILLVIFAAILAAGDDSVPPKPSPDRQLPETVAVKGTRLEQQETSK